MNVVVDCNVLVAAARIQGACRDVVDRVVRRHRMILSAPILEEYKVIADRPKHATYRDALLANIGEVRRPHHKSA